MQNQDKTELQSLAGLLAELRVKAPEIYRHLLGLIKSIAKR